MDVCRFFKNKFGGYKRSRMKLRNNPLGAANLVELSVGSLPEATLDETHE